MSLWNVNRMFRGTNGGESRVASRVDRLSTVTTRRPSPCRLVTVRFDDEGSHSFVVPAGVTSVGFELGAPGVIADVDGDPGDYDSYGALVFATFAVTPGETLTVIVGGTSVGQTGGFNGGGDGGLGPGLASHPELPGNGRGGAGASEVHRGATVLLVAGGAGGGYADRTQAGGSFDDLWAQGGYGGIPDGGDGQIPGVGGDSGGGATTSAGGAGGADGDPFGDPGEDGTAGQGGAGGDSYGTNGTFGGHGGGGGVYGGGGSSGGAATIGGGGGGSSTESGVNDLNADIPGYAALTYLDCNP